MIAHLFYFSTGASMKALKEHNRFLHGALDAVRHQTAADLVVPHAVQEEGKVQPDAVSHYCSYYLPFSRHTSDNDTIATNCIFMSSSQCAILAPAFRRY
jgi:hypothetical protein